MNRSDEETDIRGTGSRMPGRPRRRPGENRRLLLEAGIVEFGGLGYHGASTSAIAVRAGVPQPHVYANFATKQELFVACVEFAVESVVGTMPETPPESILRLLYQAFASSADPALAEALRGALEELSSALEPEAVSVLLLAAARSLSHQRL